LAEERKQPHPIRADDRRIIISELTGDKIVLDSLKTAIGQVRVTTKQAAQERWYKLGTVHVPRFKKERCF